MILPGDSAAGLHRNSQAFSEGNLRFDSCGVCQFDFPADSHRRSQADLRRDLQEDSQEDSRGDFDGALRVEGKPAGSRIVRG
jgi:hypothetical protein